jgi:hypothetical protein
MIKMKCILSDAPWKLVGATKCGNLSCNTRKEIAVVRARRGVAVLIIPVSIAVELGEGSSFLFFKSDIYIKQD